MHVAFCSAVREFSDARLHRTVAALQRAGAQVTIRAIGDVDEAPADCDLEAYEASGKVRRLVRSLVWPWQVAGDLLLTADPDMAPAALVSSRIRRRPWVADVQEDYVQVLNDRPWVPGGLRRLLQAVVRITNRLTSKADLVIVADDHVPPRAAPRRHVMRNEPDFTKLPPLPAARKPGPWRAVYVGDNRSSRGLREMVEAVAATVDDAQPWHLDLVGPIAGGDRAWFDERLARPDARNIVWHGRLEPKRSWQIAINADVGLCLLAQTPAFVEAMPSKIYEYLACGMPTIASPLPRVKDLLDANGAGIIVDGVDQTVAALRTFAEDPAERHRLVESARVQAEEGRSRPSAYDLAAARIVALAT